LHPRAAPGHHADGQGLQVGHGVADHPHTVGQTMQARGHAAPAKARRYALTASSWFGRRSKVSGFSSRPTAAAGRRGVAPAAAITASGNLAGWAVESTIKGVEGSIAPAWRRRATHMA